MITVLKGIIPIALSFAVDTAHEELVRELTNAHRLLEHLAHRPARGCPCTIAGALRKYAVAL